MTLCLVFQRSSQPSEPIKSSICSSLAKRIAFSFSKAPLTGTFCSLAFINHLYIALSKVSKPAPLRFIVLGLFPFSKAAEIFSLLFTHVNKVFKGILYFVATFFSAMPLSMSLRALYFSSKDLVVILRLRDFFSDISKQCCRIALKANCEMRFEQ